MANWYLPRRLILGLSLNVFITQVVFFSYGRSARTNGLEFLVAWATGSYRINAKIREPRYSYGEAPLMKLIGDSSRTEDGPRGRR